MKGYNGYHGNQCKQNKRRVMDWREKVTKVSEKVFPGLSKTNLKYYGYEVQSNLPLQISLSFNLTFYPIWFLLTILFIYNEFNSFDEIQKFILVTIFTATSINEGIRIYLGYQGNLKDKIPELAGFWLLSILLQFPLQIILTVNPFFNWSPIEFVAHIAMVFMLVCQVILGYLALKKTANHQATIFRILKNKNFD